MGRLSAHGGYDAERQCRDLGLCGCRCARAGEIAPKKRPVTEATRDETRGKTATSLRIYAITGRILVAGRACLGVPGQNVPPSLPPRAASAACRRARMALVPVIRHSPSLTPFPGASASGVPAMRSISVPTDGAIMWEAPNLLLFT